MAEQMAVWGLPLLACVALSGMLGGLGLEVVRREILFVDLAMAQIAALGTVAAHVCLHAHEDTPAAQVCAISLVLVAALFFSTAGRRILYVPLEALIGITYAISAAAVLFLLGMGPGGHTHVQEMLTGQLLWVGPRDLAVMAAVFIPLACLWALVVRGRSSAGGSLVRDLWFYGTLGVVVVVAVRRAGLVLVFAYLILPSTTALLLPSGRRVPRWLVAWIVGLAGSTLGLALAFWYDLAVAPSIAGVLFAGCTVVAGLCGCRRRARRMDSRPDGTRGSQ